MSEEVPGLLHVRTGPGRNTTCPENWCKRLAELIIPVVVDDDWKL